jgi:thioredoxin-related protein
MFVVVAALGAALALGAFARMGSAAEGLWETDFKAAQAKAKNEKKYLLVDFTGSDWCGWCIKLHNEVFDKEPFKTDAPKQFVLVELDFPHQKEQSDELKKQNKELSEKYEVEGFPTVLLLDAEGQVIARTGYQEGGPEAYLKHVAGFSTIYQNVVALKGKLDKAQGIERAKLLDEIVEGYQKLGNEAKEVAAWCKEIIALDPDNKAGLKVKYEFPLALKDAQELLQTGKSAEAKAAVDAALALKGIPGEMRQNGYLLKVQIAFMEKKFVDAVAALKLAKEAAPESPLAKRIEAGIQQFSKVAEAQEAANKLEAGLDKVTGLDRAKLLDKLIDVKQKLAQFDPEARGNIEAWTKEIITLDADGKAGLKKKYQFKAALADAAELLQAHKTDEANVALDKALETAGASGDDVQAAQFLKARICLTEHNNAQGAKHLKLALDAAPDSEMAPYIKKLLAQFDNRPKKPLVRKPVDE